MYQTIRWLLVAPASVITWIIIVVLGIFAYGAAQSLCPLDQLESGFCIAPWFQTVGEMIILITVALSTLGAGISAVAVAPSHKQHVTWITFTIGMAIALSFNSNSTESYVFMAIGIGFLGALAINNYPGKENNKSSN